MNKPFSIAILLVMLASAITMPVVAQDNKVDLCHSAGNGEYYLINVSEDAVPAHLAHGDGQIGDLVPAMAGAIFGEDCTPERACFDNTGGYTDLWYDGRVNTKENAWNTYSSDGTCTGGRLGSFRTLVIAETKEEADAICASNGGTQGSFNLADIDYVIPSTAWLCAGAPV